MSLLDLKSDLSKFRYNAPKPTTTLPKNRQSQNNYDNNFGTYKPITDGLIDNRPGVVEPKNINLPDKLKDTRLDDTVKKVFQESLINSVSEYSPKNIESNFGSPSRVSLESIVSAFSRINTDVVQSSIDKSNIQITKTQQGTNNNDSDIEIIDNGSEVGNITNPNITLNNIPLTYERERQSADISVNPDDAKDNIKNPDVTLNNIPLTFNRELQSVDLEKGFSLREFIVDANSNKLLSDSILNIDRTPEKYRTQSRIENREIPEKVDTSRYNGQISDLAISDSFLDLTNPEQTVLSGRHESDRNSSLSNSKDNLVDYFGNENAEGFTKKVEPLKTEYVNNSSNLGYETILEANYFDITNQYTTDGFEAFATEYDSKYKLDASRFDWDGTNAPVVNYFDVNNQFTKNGFTSFAEKFRTEYKTESSEFDWDGIRQNAPKVNYFDLTGANTKEGFHTFAIEYDSKYVHGSSRYDWDGERNDAPEVNYFDTILRHTSKGFHKFAFTKEPTTYTNDGVSLLSGGPGVGTSDFDWDGTSANAPTNDQFNPNGYFDQTNRFTTQGFHTFAQIKDTKYIPESSEFDWDGLRNQAPTNDFLNPNGYFDQNNQFTTQGFHTFAQIYDTKYIPESSQFDWDGLRSQAPTNDANNPNGYFDQNNRFTFRGFHTFASTLEATSYTNTSPGQPVTAGGVFLLGGGLGAGTSDLDWDGGGAQFNSTTSQVAPAVNYFDANGRFTFRGFHIFARTLEATSYTNTNQGQPVTAGGVFLLGGGIGVGTSDLDWDGGGAQFNSTTSQVAPAVNYFDANGRFTYRGFHIQARPLEPTSYTNTNQGQPVNAGGVFLLGGALGAGSSDFDWDGNGSQFSATTSQVAPAVNYFDANGRFTYRGFHIFARTLEPTSYTNTNQGQPVTAGGVFLLGGGLGAGSSDFDWDGAGQQFSSTTTQVAPAVNYFDANGRFTYRGFHIFARTLEPTSYTNTNQGQPVTAGGVFLLGGGLGAGSSDFDWDGNGSQFSATTSQIAPAVNYFDVNNRFTYRGFHIFARTLEPTSYTNTNQGQPITAGGVFLLGGGLGAGSSDFDWDGDGQQFSSATSQVAPAVNYFDLNNRATYRGFHIFARTLEPTSYTNTNQGQPVTAGGVFLLGGGIGAGSSDLDWDGDGQQFSANTTQVAPAVNYFDLNNRATYRGFHVFARTLEPTSYTNTNQGQPITAGGVFLLGGALGAGSSDLDWDGDGQQFSANTTQVAPAVNYFDSNGRFTYRGFHIQARPLEPTSYTNNNRNQPVIGPGTFLLGGTLGAGSSDLDWDGNGSQFSATTSQVAPAVNYFDPNNRFTFRGFHIQARPLEPTSYTNTNQNQPITAGGVSLIGGGVGVGTSDFDWDGTDPYSMGATRFFGFNQTSRFGFMVNMSQFDGTAYPIITPQFDPNILGLQGLPQRSQRSALSTLRQSLEPLQTTNLEQFAPLSFGGKSISGFKATIDNQSPVVNVQKYGFNITGYRRRGKTVGQLVDQTSASTFVINPSRVLPFMDVNRYTLGGGVDTQPTFVDGQMAIWANSGDVNAAFQTFTTTGTPVLTAAEVVALNRSFNGLPYYNGVLYKSHIDYQYSKYNLVKDSFNTSTTYPQPFVDTSLNGEDRDIFASLRSVAGLPNSVSIPGAGTVNLSGIKSTINDAINFIDRAQSFDDGIVRGGVVKNTIRALLDTKRITKFLLSPKGLLWNAKQVGLQFMNPRVDTGTGLFDGVLGLNWTNIYNPLSVPLNVAGRAGVLGLRLARHGVLMTGEGAYEDIAVDRSNNSNDRNFSSFSSPSFFNRTSDYNRLVSLTKELLPDSYKPIILTTNVQTPTGKVSVPASIPTLSTSTEIERLSTSFGGPGSFLGLFGTTINRATHPYKVVNSTAYFPKDEDIRDGLDREVFWGSTEDSLPYKKYSDFLTNSMSPVDSMGESSFNGIILALRDYIRARRIVADSPSSRGRETGDGFDQNAPYGVQKITAKRLRRSGFEQFRHPNQLERIKNTSKESIYKDYRSKSEFLSRTRVDDETNPIKNYAVGGYEDLTMDIEAKDNITDTIKLRDFRSSFESNNNSSKFNASSKVINFAKNNIDTRFGFGEAGDPGKDRSQVYVSTVQYSSLLPVTSDKNVLAMTANNYGPIPLVDSSGNVVLANYKYAAYPKQKDTIVVNDYYDEETRTTATRTVSVPKFRGDRINIIDWKRSTTDLSAPFVYERERNSDQSSLDALGGAEDLIQFYFTGARLKGSEFNPTEALVFRAYIDTIVDNHKPSWSPIKYIGRADPVYSYDGYERDINFGFTVHIGSRDEMKASWRKLNMLASWTAPEYTTNGFMRAPVIRLNLGNLYRKFPGFLSSLSYTFDNTQTTWETAKLKEDQNFKDELTKKLSMPGVLELPKTINVQCTFVTFNMYRPEWDCVFYSLFDDETGPNAVETGLAPIHDDRVNYFRTFDDLPVTHTMNSGLCAIIDQSEPPKKPVEKTPDTKPPVEEQKKPKTKCLCPIEFCVDEDRYVKADSEKAIEELANWLKSECDCAKIKLIGHANNGNKFSTTASGGREGRDRLYNIALSRSRARTVKGILVDQYGIDEKRIVTEGVGYNKPLPGIPVDDARNIRIEVVIENKEEASDCTQISLDCKDNTKCGTLAPCKRKDQGDKSEFWLVGPQYFTYKFVEDTGIGGAGPIPDSLKAISEQVDGNWWVPIVSPFGPIEYAASWRTQNAGRGYKVKGYGLKRNQSGWSDKNSRYDTNGGTVSAYLPNPDHVGPLSKEEQE